MKSLRDFILSELRTGIKSDEELLDKFLGFTFFWSKSAIVKKGSSFIRQLKLLRQEGIIEEIVSMRIDRKHKHRTGAYVSSEIFYRIINK